MRYVLFCRCFCAFVFFPLQPQQAAPYSKQVKESSIKQATMLLESGDSVQFLHERCSGTFSHSELVYLHVWFDFSWLIEWLYDWLNWFDLIWFELIDWLIGWLIDWGECSSQFRTSPMPRSSSISKGSTTSSVAGFGPWAKWKVETQASNNKSKRSIMLRTYGHTLEPA